MSYRAKLDLITAQEEIDDLRAKLAMAVAFEIVPGIRVEIRGEGHWCVTNGSACLNTFGQWEQEPSVSSRSDEFIARTRFSLEEAFRRARDFLAAQEAPHG